MRKRTRAPMDAVLSGMAAVGAVFGLAAAVPDGAIAADDVCAGLKALVADSQGGFRTTKAQREKQERKGERGSILERVETTYSSRVRVAGFQQCKVIEALEVDDGATRSWVECKTAPLQNREERKLLWERLRAQVRACFPGIQALDGGQTHEVLGFGSAKDRRWSITVADTKLGNVPVPITLDVRGPNR